MRFVAGRERRGIAATGKGAAAKSHREDAAGRGAVAEHHREDAAGRGAVAEAAGSSCWHGQLAKTAGSSSKPAMAI